MRAAGRRAVNTLSGGNMAQNLVIIHFNDVYNVEPRNGMEPVGGAARFCAAVKSFQHLQPLVLFSGDAFSPSMCEYFEKNFICVLFHIFNRKRVLFDFCKIKARNFIHKMFIFKFLVFYKSMYSVFFCKIINYELVLITSVKSTFCKMLKTQKHLYWR